MSNATLLALRPGHIRGGTGCQGVNVREKRGHIRLRDRKHRHFVVASNYTAVTRLDQHGNWVPRVQLAKRDDDCVGRWVVKRDGMTVRAFLDCDFVAPLQGTVFTSRGKRRYSQAQ
jgi:hypothetical protein